MKTLILCGAAALALLSTPAFAITPGPADPLAIATATSTSTSEAAAVAGAISGSISVASGGDAHSTSISGGGDAHSTAFGGQGGQGGDAHSSATGGIGLGGAGGDARNTVTTGPTTATSGPSSAVSGPSTSSASTGPISNVASTGPSTSSATAGPSSSTANDSSRHDQTTTVDASTHQVRQVATAYAPSVINVASCAIGGSGSVQGSTFGFSFGGAKIDGDCNRRADAAMWLQLGEREAAVARMSGMTNPEAIKLGRSR